MKKAAILLIVFLLPACGVAFSQIQVSIKARNRITGDTVTIRSVTRSRGLLAVQTDPDPRTGKPVSILCTDLRNYRYIPDNIESLWQQNMLESGVYENILKSGYSYDIRYNMEEMMKEYLSQAEKNNSFFIDSYLEARLYAILRKVYPVRHTDRRPGLLSLRILSDITPDAWVGPDGTMIISTGMIAALNSEEELMALMAQEVAHFALDHHLANYRSTLNTGVVPSLGNLIRYSTEQELEADRFAFNVLVMYGLNPSVLGSMLNSVIASGDLTGNYYLGTATGFFPDAATRAVSYSGKVSEISADYDRLIAPVISYNAYSAYNQSQYLLCRRMLERNIATGMTSADEMVLLSQAMMNLSGSVAEDEKALAVIRTVTDGLAEPPSVAFKQEALLLMRLGRHGEAENSLGKYEEALSGDEQRYRSMAGDQSRMLDYLASEKEWAARTRRR
jgi:Zn-dependent protease with chaperone function